MGNIVYIADLSKFDQGLGLESDYLEMTDQAQHDAIVSALRSLGHKVLVYSDPKEFTENISKHKNDVVLSLWSGRRSRNRRSIIPAICEGNTIKYIGADPYVALVCQDKSLTKSFLNRFGFNYPKHVLYDPSINPSYIRRLNYPVVVKPNFEGGSIGISSENLKNAPEGAINLAMELYEIYQEKILIEEFSYGAEVSICITGSNNRILRLEAIEVTYSDQEQYLYDKIYSHEEKRKKERVKYRNQINITKKINESTLSKCKNLFLSLGKVDYMRIDGRLVGDNFTVIELTPDVGLSPEGIFASSFLSTGSKFEEMIDHLITL